MPLRWIRTGDTPGWGAPPSDDDWLAYDEDFPVGRILQHRAGPAQGIWTWSVTGIHLGEARGRGSAPTRREAAIALRDAWRARRASDKAVGVLRHEILARLNWRDGKR